MNSEGDQTLLIRPKYRAITYNWDILSKYGSEANLYCLTDFQAAWLSSNTSYFAWKTRWENCPCTDEELALMRAELDYNLTNCFDTRWMGNLNYLFERSVNEQLQEFADEYALGGIAGINADTPTDFYNGDASSDRDIALCMACDTYVRSYLNVWLQQAALLIGLVSVLGIFVASTPFIGLIAGVVIAGLAFITQTAVDAVNDSDAVNDVICCMFNGLYSQTVTEANFQAALDGCAFTVGSNQEIIRSLMVGDLAQSKNWFSFLDALGQSYVLISAGVTFNCDCVPAPVQWQWDSSFTVTKNVFVPKNSGYGDLAGWTSGTGWTTKSNQLSPTGYSRLQYITSSFSDTRIKVVTMVFDLTKGSFNNTSQAVYSIVLWLGGVQVANTQVSFASASNGTNKVFTLTTNVICDQIDILVRSSSQPTATYSGAVKLTSLHIEGEGSNPF